MKITTHHTVNPFSVAHRQRPLLFPSLGSPSQLLDAETQICLNIQMCQDLHLHMCPGLGSLDSLWNQCKMVYNENRYSKILFDVNFRRSNLIHSKNHKWSVQLRKRSSPHLCDICKEIRKFKWNWELCFIQDFHGYQCRTIVHERMYFI